MPHDGRVEEARTTLGNAADVEHEVLGPDHMITLITQARAHRLSCDQPGKRALGLRHLASVVEHMRVTHGDADRQTVKWAGELAALEDLSMPRVDPSSDQRRWSLPDNEALLTQTHSSLDWTQIVSEMTQLRRASTIRAPKTGLRFVYAVDDDEDAEGLSPLSDMINAKTIAKH